MSYFDNVQYHREETPSLDEIRNKLIKYPGGNIIYEKDEENGLAKICINHPERKNAISGKFTFVKNFIRNTHV